MAFSGRDVDFKVDILMKKYLEKKNLVSANQVSKKHQDKPAKRCSEEAKSARREMRRALEELYSAVSDPPQWFVWDKNTLDGEDKPGDGSDAPDHTDIPWTETDVTLPSDVACTSWSSEAMPAGRAGLRRVEHVYHEMIQIYEKLQARAADLCERERVLQRREKLLLKHQSAINRLLTAEEDVFDRVNSTQQEMECLRAALREKTKENRRIQSSFNSIKELNDGMRRQLTEVSEQNTRLENQARKVQARLANLQRKHEFSAAHHGQTLKSIDPKPSIQDKAPPPRKAQKSVSGSTTLRLLSDMMDWIVEGPPFPSDVKEERGFEPYGVPPHPSLHERCAKVLPVLLEQLHEAESILNLPLLRFIYCSLTQLEHSTQHLPLTTTLRRLGEEVKSPALLRSSCLHTRFFSSIIILKTLSQVDILAQALSIMQAVVGQDEGRGLFLKYEALASVVALLRTESPGLLSPTLDVLLQMSAESRYLPSFLEACSTPHFFRRLAALLQNPRPVLAEKISVLLQKLSGIRNNQRLFEVVSLPRLLQEAQSSADPSQTFLHITVSSILFNLGMASNP